MNKVLALILLIALVSCNQDTENNHSTKQSRLPIYGVKDFIPTIDKDTVYHTIPYWEFINQDGDTVSKSDYNGKIYVANFFFSHCMGICPILTKNIRKIQEKTEGENILFISHTVDPKNDTTERLKWYAEKNNADLSNWNFVTGNQGEINELGVNSYLVPSEEDVLAPGGFLHSDKFILIDKLARIRGIYNGTEDAEVDKLLKDIQILKKEYE